MSVTNAEDTSQATKGIVELFKEFLVNLNFSLRCNDVQGWLFWIADVEAVFPRLSTRSGVLARRYAGRSRCPAEHYSRITRERVWNSYVFVIERTGRHDVST